MGTYHSFISQPLNEEEANQLLIDVQKVIENSNYRNDKNNFSVSSVGGFFVVIGVYKNLGNLPAELIAISNDKDWATVSDEKDFYNSEL